MKTRYHYIDDCNGFDIYEAREGKNNKYYVCCMNGENPYEIVETVEDTEEAIFEFCESH